jgi:ubiquinone/menaquinone biosynthesis C-methylase UbiE
MPSSTTSKDSQFNKLLDYVLGNQATWIASIGLRTGLFQAIADAGEPGIAEPVLAERLGYNLKYVAVWCRSAFAFELLDWDEAAGYRPAPHMETLLLDETDPQFMGGRLQIYAAFYEDYLVFPDYLSTAATEPSRTRDSFLIKAIQTSSKPDCVMITDSVLPQAPQTLAQLEAGGHILDVGAGGGYHAVHYARRFPQTTVTGLEFDKASVAVARQTVTEAGLTGQIDIQHGDANQLSAENLYDLVTMNLALHETGGPAEYRNVLCRIHRALKPGATLIVSELPYPDSLYAYRQDPVYKKLAGLQLHEVLAGCGMITQGELPRLLQQAHFTNVRVAEQPLSTRFVMIGEKSG